MKRSEPQWKREAARKHCAEQNEKMWKILSSVNNDVSEEVRRWLTLEEIDMITNKSTPVRYL